MTHAFDRHVDIGDAYESLSLRITVDFEDEDGEPIGKPNRCVAIEVEQTGEMFSLSKEQTKELVHTLQDGLRVLGVPAHALVPRKRD